MRQRAAVDVFEFAAERHAVRQAAGPHVALARELREVVCGRLALDGGIGGDDQFRDLALVQSLRQQVQAQLARAEAVARRKLAA